MTEQDRIANEIIEEVIKEEKNYEEKKMKAYRKYMKMNGIQRFVLQVQLGVVRLPQKLAHPIVIKYLINTL